jgi:hypothetical protein
MHACLRFFYRTTLHSLLHSVYLFSYYRRDLNEISRDLNLLVQDSGVKLGESFEFPSTHAITNQCVLEFMKSYFKIPFFLSSLCSPLADRIEITVASASSNVDSGVGKLRSAATSQVLHPDTDFSLNNYPIALWMNTGLIAKQTMLAAACCCARASNRDNCLGSAAA